MLCVLGMNTAPIASIVVSAIGTEANVGGRNRERTYFFFFGVAAGGAAGGASGAGGAPSG
jgi:hypothetical protein